MKNIAFLKPVRRYLNRKASDNGYLGLVFLISVAAFFIYLWVAYHLPGDKTVPDESMRRMIPFYLIQTGKLPTGFEIELNQANGYGFSYASYPPLPTLLSAFFIRVAMLFTENQRLLIIASRLGNVVLGMVSVVYLMKIGRLYFQSILSAVVMTLTVSFMPQVVFISSYFNADSMSLCTVVMILYYLLSGERQGWNYKSCAKLAVSMSACILTYYNAYGWCLLAVIYCVVRVVHSPDITQKAQFILRRAALIAAICIALTGWFFIRNYILYQGDFLAIHIRSVIANETAAQGYPVHTCSPYMNISQNIFRMLFTTDGWIEYTAKSTVGVFSAMTAFLPKALYGIYGGLLALGAIFAIPFCVRDKEKRLLYCFLLFGSIIVIGLSACYSYASDYQPQGRYIISVLPALALFEAIGWRELGKKVSSLKGSNTRQTVKIIQLGFVIIWLIAFSLAYKTLESTFTKNKLTYDVQNGTNEIRIEYVPSDNDQLKKVNFAVWDPNVSAPVWYSAETDGSVWSVRYLYGRQSNGEYCVHIYGENTDGKYEKLLESQFRIRDGSVLISE